MNSDRRPVNDESGCVSLPDSPTAAGGRHWIDAFDGSRLAACRRARGLSQVELAERLQQARAGTDVSVAEAARQIRTLVVQVSCYEAGRTRPRARALQALAGALDVDVLDLLSTDTAVTLAALRARRGLTQGAVAGQLGMSRSLYAAVEQGRRPVSDAELTQLATVLAVDADRLRRALPA
jgi:transcriptional regulator with XRE-family HTH domain